MRPTDVGTFAGFADVRVGLAPQTVTELPSGGITLCALLHRLGTGRARLSQGSPSMPATTVHAAGGTWQATASRHRPVRSTGVLVVADGLEQSPALPAARTSDGAGMQRARRRVGQRRPRRSAARTGAWAVALSSLAEPGPRSAKEFTEERHTAGTPVSGSRETVGDIGPTGRQAPAWRRSPRGSAPGEREIVNADAMAVSRHVG